LGTLRLERMMKGPSCIVAGRPLLAYSPEGVAVQDCPSCGRQRIWDSRTGPGGLERKPPMTLTLIITVVWLLAAWRIVGAGWCLVRLAEQPLPAGSLLERVD